MAKLKMPLSVVGGVDDVVEHVPGHLPVLVGRGVAQHGPHQDDADS